jgi:antitoxin CptB
MIEPQDVRLKRLRFRSWHRGMREMDLLLGRFADRHLPAMNDEQLGQYEALLGVADADLYNWIADQAPTPPPFDNGVLTLIRNFKMNYLII